MLFIGGIYIFHNGANSVQHQFWGRSFSPYRVPSNISIKFCLIYQSPLSASTSNIPISRKLFEFTMRPELPFTIVCGYLAVIAILNKRQDGKNRMKGHGGKPSSYYTTSSWPGWTFLGTGPATINYFLRGYQTAGVPGLVHNFCDSSMTLWDEVMARYTYMFYLSKFWEILDTLILIGKGKRASLLQEYHHASGAHHHVHILRALSGSHSSTRSPQTLVDQDPDRSILNRRKPGRSHVVTPASQELGDKFEWQPVLANHPFASDRLGQGFKEELCLHTPGQMVTVVGGVGYLIPLTGLFVSFYIKSYRRKISQKSRLAISTEKDTSIEKH
ncbi:hypothetical protein H4Q26_007498 [Puccinia striiformis f. sp. tritici PST-130]|nr:hypothetical protein H4Q26_007498 [Puccinia striiformis f. sp. tritici PST-130]